MSASPMPAAVATAVEVRSGENCEAMIRGVPCTMRGEHLHHRLLRSQGGRHTLANIVHICHLCHDWIHDNPALAAQLGFIVRRGAGPETVPVKRRDRWVLLDSAGGLTAIERSEPPVLLSKIDWGATTNWQ